MAPVDIPGGIQLPPAPVLEAILKQQKNGAEVGPAEPSSNQIDVDIKNPAFEAQRKTKQRVSDIFIYGEKKAVIAETKQQIAETKEMEVKRKYKRLHEIINEELQIKNIDIILSQPKGKLLEVHLYGLYNGWFDKDGNIVLKWGTIIKKGTQEYNQMLEKALEEFRIVIHALYCDAEERWRDPDTIKKLP